VAAATLARRRFPAAVLLLSAVDTAALPATPSAGLPIASYAVACYDDRRVRQWALLAAGSASVLRPWSIGTLEVAGQRAFAAGVLVLLPAG
jgi:hypothetical protein